MEVKIFLLSTIFSLDENKYSADDVFEKFK